MGVVETKCRSGVHAEFMGGKWCHLKSARHIAHVPSASLLSFQSASLQPGSDRHR